MKNLAVKNEMKNLQSALTGKSAFDSRSLEEIFERCRLSEDKMKKLIEAFCAAYLYDAKQRALKLRPLQIDIISASLCYDGDGGQRKMAILAPRGCGKSYALSVAVVIYMFFKRFRDLVFVLAPSEDQAALIFGYVYRHFKDNTFLDSLVDNYKFHNKPHIRLKGGTLLRRAPLAPSNQGQAIRGQHPTFCIVDESPLIDDHLFVDNVEPAIVSNRAPFINLGTPKSKSNHMWRYLYDDAYADSFTRMVFTWRDAVEKGEAYSAPYTEEDMLEKMMEWGEDSMYWRTEYECEFVESVSNVFNPEKLKACFYDYDIQTPETLEQGRGKYTQVTVGVDVGKSVNSTVITGWQREKSVGDNAGEDLARLIYIEEISARTGGHDIPYQRRRIMEVSTVLGADKLIIDATGIGGAIEQDLRVACIQASPQIHFIPFVFTGGPKGTKTQAFRDYVSFVQQQRVHLPNPDKLEPIAAKLVNKWLRQHIELEYVMDAADKTERISAPDGKFDDYCDSCVIALHATLTMLPGAGAFASTRIGQTPITVTPAGRPARQSLFTTKQRKVKLNKYNMRGI
jgi:hypothetical protein